MLIPSIASDYPNGRAKRFTDVRFPLHDVHIAKYYRFREFYNYSKYDTSIGMEIVGMATVEISWP